MQEKDVVGTSRWFPNYSIGAKTIRAEYSRGPLDQPVNSHPPAGSDLAAWVFTQQQVNSVLTNPKSSDVDKLKAVETLAMSGTTAFEIPDANGKSRNYIIERQQIGRGQYAVHLFSQDDEGKSHVVLRGVSNEDGTYRRQRGDDGNYADFQGSWWSEHMRQSPFAQPNGPPAEAPITTAPPQPRSKPIPPEAAIPPSPRPPHRAETAPPPEPNNPVPGSANHRVVDRRRFFAVQPDQFGCGPTALAMARSDFITGQPPGPDEIRHLEAVTGTTANGLYPGGADEMAADARRYAGLNAKAYNYGPNQGRYAMDLLDKELKQGHGAVVWIRNENTGHGHWGYVAGIDNKSGRYILGDPGGSRTGIYAEHLNPVSREHLASLLDFRTGFAAVWGNVG